MILRSITSKSNALCNEEIPKENKHADPLPDEIVMHIFSYFQNYITFHYASLVNRQWNRISRDHFIEQKFSKWLPVEKDAFGVYHREGLHRYQYLAGLKRTSVSDLYKEVFRVKGNIIPHRIEMIDIMSKYRFFRKWVVRLVVLTAFGFLILVFWDRITPKWKCP